MDATTIGVDLAKTVFELALANAAWRLIGRKRLTRPQFERFLATHPAIHVVMEACGTAHHWARVARAHGHHVTLLPPQYVRPYVRRNKTDRTDAEALLEAVRSGQIAPVTVKTVAQQELLALHRVRAEWMATRTARLNAMRGLLQEHGLSIARGARTALADSEAPRGRGGADSRTPPRGAQPPAQGSTRRRGESRGAGRGPHDDRPRGSERHAIDDGAGHRPDHGHCLGGDGRAHPRVPRRAALRELAGPDTK
jgi:transposase